MNKFRHPPHYLGHLKPLDAPIRIHGQHNPYVLADTCARLVCLCEKDTFSIYISDYPSVQCRCASCHEEFLVYDVRQYPAATAYSQAKGVFTLWESPHASGPYQVLVEYSYPDDAQDANDLDWFTLVAKAHDMDEYEEVVNDETA